ncbi:hypothetical protein KIMC2_09500 [Xylocopilactobacillus apis]|uniref:Uncharacterized protein n=1 Tax=Xylocopilactobacillus apis TaxID=2932183 RepID=A0AAU9DRX3_9LACO|nr:hypothetical protein KIMC2_09500 [Xylocopilactobacillus apis]
MPDMNTTITLKTIKRLRKPINEYIISNKPNIHKPIWLDKRFNCSLDVVFTVTKIDVIIVKSEK